MIIVLTGLEGTGKTTLARELENRISNSVVIDGDELRKICQNKDYSKEGRERNIQLAIQLTSILKNKHKNIIISLINPYKKYRAELKDMGAIEFKLINKNSKKIQYSLDIYEESDYPVHQIDTNSLSIDESVNFILEKI